MDDSFMGVALIRIVNIARVYRLSVYRCVFTEKIISAVMAA